MNESLSRRLVRALPMLILGTVALLLAGNLWRISQPPRPDPRMVSLAVRATVYALPTATPWVIEVTRVITATVMVAPTPVLADANTPAPPTTATPTLAPATAVTPGCPGVTRR
ncbi:MAG: hypothetical protein IPK16_19795 [Anaerolineales bacterium]|nr:hypothetical protein [Anaerolineales bacterium]